MDIIYASKIIIAFRNFCIKKYPDDIFAVKEIAYKRFLLTDSEDLDSVNETYYKMLGETRADYTTYISKLAKTPRVLKQILRRTLYTWDTLHGEINFEDLLVLNSLRFGASKAYDFLLEHVSFIRGLESHGSIVQEKQSKKRQIIHEKWNAISQDAEWDDVSASKLIAFIFPSWDVDITFGSNKVPQMVNDSTPVDYWIRANTEIIERNEIRDQEVLLAIETWQNSESAKAFRDYTLPAALCHNSDFSKIFEYFGKWVMNYKTLRKLASELFAEILEYYGNAADRDSSLAFTSLWRLYLRADYNKIHHEEWLYQELSNALKVSLSFSNDIFNFWSHENDFQQAPPIKPEIHMHYKEIVKSTYYSNKSAFLNALDDTKVYSIYHLVVLYSQPRFGGTDLGTEIDDWRWLITMILESAIDNPSAYAVYLAPMIARSQITDDGKTFQFDEKVASTVFDDKLPDVMNMFLEINIHQQDKEMHDLLIAANEIAINWVKNNKNGTDSGILLFDEDNEGTEQNEDE
ncbi:MAG: hypothetical protein OEY89_14390 [Gammaproteobacteria bacterium]|nr:hypothetical protein [Gammaproteobacteria bacterium]